MVGNKRDLNKDGLRVVDETEGEEVKDRLKLEYFTEMSAKS